MRRPSVIPPHRLSAPGAIFLARRRAASHSPNERPQSMSVKRFVPSLSTAVVAGLVARIARPRTRLQRFLALLLVLNWRSLPFVWHVQLWGCVPFPASWSVYTLEYAELTWCWVR